MSQALKGIRVIDMTGIVFGPVATQALADWGADVIKVESPEGDTLRHAGVARHRGMGAIFLNLNRGKRSIALDLAQRAGRAVIRELLTDTRHTCQNGLVTMTCSSTPSPASSRARCRSRDRTRPAAGPSAWRRRCRTSG